MSVVAARRAAGSRARRPRTTGRLIMSVALVIAGLVLVAQLVAIGLWVTGGRGTTGPQTAVVTTVKPSTATSVGSAPSHPTNRQEFGSRR